MKKSWKTRMLSIVASFALALSLVVFPAHAQGGTTIAKVTIGDQMPQAVSTVVDLIDTVNSAEAAVVVEINSDFTIDGMMEFTTDQSLTINGNGHKITTDFTDSKNMVQFNGAGNAAISKITLIAGENTKHALNIWMSHVDVTDVTVDHTNASGGAPVIVAGSSEASFNGQLNLTLGTNSWYGVNVDNSEAAFNGDIIVAGAPVATQSVVCVENKGTTEGLAYTTVETNDGQVAYVEANQVVKFINAKGDTVTNVTLQDNIDVSEPLYLSGKDMVVDGNGYQLIGTESLGKENVVTVMADGVSLNQVSIQTNSANKSGLHIYRATVTATDLTVDNTQTSGGAAVLVNGGGLELNGETSLMLGDNSWGGINVDVNDAASAKVTFADDATLSYDAPDGKAVIYFDADETEEDLAKVTIDVDSVLVKDENGNYMPKKLPEIIIDFPSEVVVGETVEFSVSTIANDYKGVMVEGINLDAQLPQYENLEYYEVKDGKWYPLEGISFGPQGGFPLTDATSKFRATFTEAKEGYFTVAIQTVDGEKILAQKTANVKVVEAEQPEEPEKEKVTVTLVGVVDGEVLSDTTKVVEVEKGSVLTDEVIAQLNEIAKSFDVEGYEFDGFFYDQEGTDRLASNDVLDQDTTIYLIWSTKQETPPVDDGKDEPTQPTEEEKPEELVQTGDNNMIMLFAGMALVSGGLLVALNKKRLFNK